MNITEPIEVINKRLIDFYGVYSKTQPYYRVVWSEDQLETRLFNTTPEGLHLLTPELREVPKYRQYVDHKYILERLTEVPDFQQNELGVKLSYEPVWVFEDKDGFPLPPVWRVCQILVQTIKENTHNKGRRAPEQSGLHEDNTTEALMEKEKLLAEALYGNETSTGDALAHGSGVGYGNAPHRKLS